MPSPGRPDDLERLESDPSDRLVIASVKRLPGRRVVNGHASVSRFGASDDDAQQARHSSNYGDSCWRSSPRARPQPSIGSRSRRACQRVMTDHRFALGVCTAHQLRDQRLETSRFLAVCLAGGGQPQTRLASTNVMSRASWGLPILGSALPVGRRSRLSAEDR